ncbi:site-specific integrase [Achromobacter aegrifaciens]
MRPQNLPSVIQGYFLEYLPQHKGLQSSTIRSYRDSVRLFLIFVADAKRCGVSKLDLEHLDYPAVQAFYTTWKSGGAMPSVPATSA